MSKMTLSYLYHQLTSVPLIISFLLIVTLALPQIALNSYASSAAISLAKLALRSKELFQVKRSEKS